MENGIYKTKEGTKVYVEHTHVFYFFKKAIGFNEDGTRITKRRDLRKLIPLYTNPKHGILDFFGEPPAPRYNNPKK